jgi:hypothetical protein
MREQGGREEREESTRHGRGGAEPGGDPPGRREAGAGRLDIADRIEYAFLSRHERAWVTDSRGRSAPRRAAAVRRPRRST